MEAIEIVKEIRKNKTPYQCAVFLLEKYKDLENGKEVIEEHSKVLDLMYKVFNLIKDERYIDVVEYHYKKGYSVKKTAICMNVDIATVYRTRRKIAQRIAVILYGDEALL